MLFCTSLVALVGAGERPSSSTRRLQIVNTKVTSSHTTHSKYRPDEMMKRQSTICELQFPTTILAVKLNRRRLVVVLEERIYVYDISNMKLLHEIETSLNPQGPFPFSSHPILILHFLTFIPPSRSHLRSLTLVREQLPRLPFPAPLSRDSLLLDPTSLFLAHLFSIQR